MRAERDEKAEAELASLAPWAQQMVRDAMADHPALTLIEAIDILEWATGIGSAPARARNMGKGSTS
jgi:hypothetical protein